MRAVPARDRSRLRPRHRLNRLGGSLALSFGPSAWRGLFKRAATIACLPAAVALGSAAYGRGQVPDPPVIHASAAILIDAETRQVLYERNADVRRPPASTTKILTAILLIEHVPPDELIEADKACSETDGSSLYMMPGEKIAAREMRYALLLRSANDACVAIAKHIAGSVEAFAEMMNRRAAEMGATHSHFSNPNGLPAKDHWTTARDLALIAAHAMRIPEFRETASTRYRTIKRDPRNKDTFLKNRARFLWHYPGAEGIKTGYTVTAGRCFVGSATRNGWRLISVVLNSPDMFGETRRLMDYGFTAFEPVEVLPAGGFRTTVGVLGGASSSVRVVSSAPLRIIAPRGTQAMPALVPSIRTPTAPVALGAPLGELVAKMPNGAAVSVPLIAATAVRARPKPPPPSKAWPRLLATALAMAVFLYGSASSKTTGRFRNRVATRVRGDHRVGPRQR